MIFDRNAIWVGLLLGLAVPLVGYALLLTIFEQLEAFGLVSQEGFSKNFRLRTLTVIAICCNVIPFNYYQRKRYLQSMRGLIFPTLLYAIVWVINFGQEVF